MAFRTFVEKRDARIGRSQATISRQGLWAEAGTRSTQARCGSRCEPSPSAKTSLPFGEASNASTMGPSHCSISGVTPPRLGAEGLRPKAVTNEKDTPCGAFCPATHPATAAVWRETGRRSGQVRRLGNRSSASWKSIRSSSLIGATEMSRCSSTSNGCRQRSTRAPARNNSVITPRTASFLAAPRP